MIFPARGKGGGISILRAKIALGGDARSHRKGLRRKRALVSVFASISIVLGGSAAYSAPAHKHIHPHRSGAAKSQHHQKPKRIEHAVGPRLPLHAAGAETAPELAPELTTIKQALALVRQRKFGEAKTLAISIGDPVAQKLVEWALLRHPDNLVGFDRYESFVQTNPEWPSIPLLRRRAEARLWRNPRSAAVVRQFVGSQPAGALGHLALARAQLNEGHRSEAEREVRAVWRSAELSAESESAAADVFQNELTRADHIIRMDRRIGAKEFGAAMRAAKRLGSDYLAIVKACEAAEAKSNRAGELLANVPKEARTDLAYDLCRVHWLLKRNELSAAVAVLADLAQDDLQHQDTDEWWRECRFLARRLIDQGIAKTAYEVVRHAPIPANPYYRAEYYFMAGWIALRFLQEPSTAAKHFAHIDDATADPIVLARAAYWRGRAAEASGRVEEALKQYEAAARYPTAYYGQLARARLGLGKPSLDRASTSTEAAQTELLHAAHILYAIGEFDLVLTFISDLGETNTNVETLRGLGQLTEQYHDAQAMLIFGKAALARGLPIERYAFPRLGIPPYKPIAPSIEQRVVYSIVRTESGFDQRDRSPASAVGLMQVTPEAGRDTAKRFGVSYDWDRLVSDPVYNMQMGAGEISALLKEYAGSYILTFAGYNAGRGRVKEWIAKHGDPRDPKIDAVDWVERIPLAETRNYVQRVMENLQVYSIFFGYPTAAEPNLYRAAMNEDRPQPASLVQSIP